MPLHVSMAPRRCMYTGLRMAGAAEPILCSGGARTGKTEKPS
ncbi:MAG TPA: hypothetical protein VKY57_00705 [Chitinispirillaceae bacterium]|nr:hypothetical protein [Chitinispirillaceae bacterium]